MTYNKRRIDVYVDRGDLDEAVAEIEGHLEEIGILAEVEL